MGKWKLTAGLAAGAIAGGLVALCDRETRLYTKGKMYDCKNQATYYLKHPSEAIRNAKDACDQFNDSFGNGAANAINAIEQVEETINKIANKTNKKLEVIEAPSVTN